MLSTTVNLALWIIQTVFLYSDGDELSVVDCISRVNYGWKREQCADICVLPGATRSFTLTINLSI